MIDQAPWEGTPGQSHASGIVKPYEADEDAEAILRTVLNRRNFGVDVRDRLAAFLVRLIAVRNEKRIEHARQVGVRVVYDGYPDATYVQERIMLKRMYSVDQTQLMAEVLEKIVGREMQKRNARCTRA